MHLRSGTLAALAILAALATASKSYAAPLGPGVTYQGQLKQSGSPFSGTAAMEFRLYDAGSGGTLIGSQTIASVAVTGGLFTVTLNSTGQFGTNAFNGDDRWLEIWVNGMALTPRQQISAAPYAHALRLPLIESIAGSSDLLSITNTGNAGSAGVFSIASISNLSSALRATAGGLATAFSASAQTGAAVTATANAGRAGIFQSSGSFPTLSITNTIANGTALTADGSVGIGISSPTARLHVTGAGSSGLSLNVDNKLYVDAPNDFIGINRTGSIGAEVFGIRANVSGNTYGGMYLETSDTNGKPFYGYATNGAARAWHYYNALTTTWSLYNNGDRLSVLSDGKVGIGTTSPAYRLDVADRVRVRQGASASAGIWFYQNTPAADRAFIGMKDDTHMGLWGNTGAGWNFVMDTTTGYVGLGTAAPAVRLDVSGTVRCDVLEINGADVAERFPTTDKPEPGTVMEIDPDHPGHLRIAREPYSPRVAGVVSGANAFPAGTILGNKPGQHDAPAVALSGRVYVRCDATHAAIQVGDLLTTADTAGQAMKAADHNRTAGAVIGKAMTALPQGKTGFVLVLVSLQ